MTVSRSRSGMILFVVVAMLGLFAVVSIVFYYYAAQENMVARVSLEEHNNTRPDPDALLAYALRMLVFDEAGNGPFQSAIAMHSLLRNMFGSEGLEPFCGTGRFHGPDYDYFAPGSGNWYDRYYAVCYVSNNNPNRRYNPTYDGTFHPPYTAPDMNHVFLGHLGVDPNTGQLVVTAQSFIRRSFPGVAEPTPQQVFFDPYDPANLGFWTNPNWRPSNAPPGNVALPAQLRQALVFRPLPLLHPSFPPPADIGGDVRNLPPGLPVRLPDGQLHYGNDSIWMDLGFPVQVGPDGRVYKPLFAFFITDLDGRVNLNSWSNSSLLWNFQPVLGQSLSPGYYFPCEGEFLWRHADTNADSFTSVLFPALPNTLRDMRRRHMLTVASSDIRWAGFAPQLYREPWSDASQQTDAYNAISYLPVGNPDDGPRWSLPQAHPQTYPLPQGVLQGNPGPGNNPRVFWTWQGSVAAPGVGRQFVQAYQANQFNQGDFRVVQNQQTSTWEWTGRIARNVNRYDGKGQIVGTASFPSHERLNLTSRVNTINSQAAYPPVVDLHNDPAAGPVKQQLSRAILARQALARDIYFRLLYVCGLLDENPAALINVPTPPWFMSVYPNRQPTPPYWPPHGVRARVANPLDPTDDELKPLRYLAQLAVNIVDYLDSDNYSTPFMFYTDMDGYPLDDPSRPGNAPAPNLRYWVFGTERPRVIINEALFEYQEPFDGNKNLRVDGKFDVYCWIELLNAPGSPAEILGPDDPNDPNRKVTVPRYRLIVASAEHLNNPVDPIAGAANGDNVLGEANSTHIRAQTNDSDLLQPPPQNQTAPTPPWHLPPVMGNWTNNDPHLLIGPSGDTVDKTLSDPNNAPLNRIQTDNLKFTLERKTDQNGNVQWHFTDAQNNTFVESRNYLVLLRRLAYPQMNALNVPQTLALFKDPQSGNLIPDYDPNHNALVVNPYVTQDMLAVRPNFGLADRTVNAQGNPTGASVSWARTNPYADFLCSPHNQQNPNPLQVNMQPTNTWHSLGKANPRFVNNPWPAQPDNAALSTLELLRVSAYKTHLLTRRYLNPNHPEYHYAPWFDPTARIYRVLEFLELVPPNLAAMYVSPYRVRGKVNLNTAPAEEVLAAISEWVTATGQPGASGQNITQKWSEWLKTRQGRPNWGFASGYLGAGGPLPQGLNAEDSWWRWDGAGQRILLNDNHPPTPLQEHASFFANIYDRVTSRSNVFAVWCTVGFFEVDPNTGTLGPEIDADAGRQVRYRFFAIVDRTILAEWLLQNGQPVEKHLGRTDIDPRRRGTNGEPACVLYWSRIQ
ncbi:MAG: hypothetical protein RMJ82_06315 [Gemmatales bacterium]|nr:hypothetical protein [Gemmatales bacterium]